MPGGEREIYELVRKRLIAAVSPKHVYEAVMVTLDCGGNTFTAKGKTVIKQGWKAAQNATDTDDDGENDDSGDLPALSKGQIFESANITVKEAFHADFAHFVNNPKLARSY
jgi:DNA topoisomerase-3